MNYKDRKYIRLSYAARGANEAMAHLKEIGIYLPMVKAKLFPKFVVHANSLMEQEYDPIYDEGPIPPPDEKFYANNWKDICFLIAELYRTYIIPAPGSSGVFLGTFEEYIKIPFERDAAIVQGVCNATARRAEIIRKQGGQASVLDNMIKQLPSGN
jgi:hypothetical protein